jgi:phosphatidylglycerol---prolipoprotein diacylglyceryl transferase
MCRPLNQADAARLSAMVFPIDVHVAGWTISSHLVFETLAYAVAFRLYLSRRRRLGDHVSDSHRWSLLAAAAVGAVVGSRLLFWLEDPAVTIAKLTGPDLLTAGKTLVGGLVGAWIAVELIKRRLGVRQPTGDLFAVPLAVGIAIGRIGCFLSGLPDGTYGLPTALPWGIDLGDGIPRHPTALYEMAFASMLAGVLVWFERASRQGDAFKLFMAAYLSFRLAVDTIKPGHRIALGLTAIQWTCIAGLAYYAWWLARGAPTTAPATLTREPAADVVQSRMR